MQAFSTKTEVSIYVMDRICFLARDLYDKNAEGSFRERLEELLHLYKKLCSHNWSAEASK